MTEIRVRTDESIEANRPYLTVLAERRGFGAMQLHAGLARYSFGRALCNDQRMMEFQLAMRHEYLALYRPDRIRHRAVESWLELNRGCTTCLGILYQIARDAGWSRRQLEKQIGES
jgi:hypothetical protein